MVCQCGKLAERNGSCASCNRLARKLEAENNKPKAKKKPISRQSPKRKMEDSEYSQLRREWLPGKRCAVYPFLEATEVHHQKGRQGYADDWARENGITLLLDVRFWLPVSHIAHEKITKESAWAIDKGYTLLRSTLI